MPEFLRHHSFGKICYRKTSPSCAGNARDSRFHRKRVIFVEKSFTNSNSHSGIVCAKTDSIAPLPQTARQCKSASPPKKSAYFLPCFQFPFLLHSGMLTRSRLLILPCRILYSYSTKVCYLLLPIRAHPIHPWFQIISCSFEIIYW